MSHTDSGRSPVPPSGGRPPGSGITAMLVLLGTFIFVLTMIAFGYDVDTALLAAGLAGSVAYETWRRFNGKP